MSNINVAIAAFSWNVPKIVGEDRNNMDTSGKVGLDTIYSGSSIYTADSTSIYYAAPRAQNIKFSRQLKTNNKYDATIIFVTILNLAYLHQ